jgi:hypothetical protein
LPPKPAQRAGCPFAGKLLQFRKASRKHQMQQRAMLEHACRQASSLSALLTPWTHVIRELVASVGERAAASATALQASEQECGAAAVRSTALEAELAV